MKEKILLKCPKNVVTEVKLLLRELEATKGKVRYLSNYVPQNKLSVLQDKGERDWQIYESLKGEYKIDQESETK